MKFKLILCGVLLIAGCTSKKYVGQLKAIAYVDNAQTTYADGFTEDDIGSLRSYTVQKQPFMKFGISIMK